jgi:hypothetical protein
MLTATMKGMPSNRLLNKEEAICFRQFNVKF